jgi:hypothetical protein
VYNGNKMLERWGSKNFLSPSTPHFCISIVIVVEVDSMGAALHKNYGEFTVFLGYCDLLYQHSQVRVACCTISDNTVDQIDAFLASLL